MSHVTTSLSPLHSPLPLFHFPTGHPCACPFPLSTLSSSAHQHLHIHVHVLTHTLSSTHMHSPLSPSPPPPLPLSPPPLPLSPSPLLLPPPLPLSAPSPLQVPPNLNGTTGQRYRISYRSDKDTYPRSQIVYPYSQQLNASTLNGTITNLQRDTEYVIQVRLEVYYSTCYNYFYGNYSKNISASTNATSEGGYTHSYGLRRENH